MWYGNLKKGLEKRGFKKSDDYTCLFISKIVICIENVYDCLFWYLSQADIEGVLK